MRSAESKAGPLHSSSCASCGRKVRREPAQRRLGTEKRLANTNCAGFSAKYSPSGNYPTRSSSYRKFLALPWASSKRQLCANSSPTGNGREWLCAITGVDADVLRGEIARPITGFGRPRVQIHDDGYVVREETVAGGALVEVERLAAAQHRNARHGNVHT